MFRDESGTVPGAKRPQSLRFLSILLLAAIGITLAGTVLGALAYSRDPYVVRYETAYRYVKRSEYSVLFHLKPNQIYESASLPAELASPIYLNLIDNVTISYSYRVEGAAEAAGEVRTVVLLKHPDGWAKVYGERAEGFGTAVSYELTIDLDEAVSYMSRLCREANMRLNAFNISITSHVKQKVRAGPALRDEALTHVVVMTVDVSKNRVSLAAPLRYVEPVEEKRATYVRQSLLGFDVEGLRVTSTVTALVGVISTAITSLLRFGLHRTRRSSLEDFERKYRSLIVRAVDSPPHSEKVVRVRGPDELVKVSKLLERPIVRYDGVRRDTGAVYMVIDKDVAYLLEMEAAR